MSAELSAKLEQFKNESQRKLTEAFKDLTGRGLALEVKWETFETPEAVDDLARFLEENVWDAFKAVAVTDVSKQILGNSIQKISAEFTGNVAGTVSLNQGVLHISCNWSVHPIPKRNYIGLLNKELRLEILSFQAEAEKSRWPSIVSQVRETLNSDVKLEIDWLSFKSVNDAKSCIGLLESELITALQESTQAKATVKSIVIKHQPDLNPDMKIENSVLMLSCHWSEMGIYKNQILELIDSL